MTDFSIVIHSPLHSSECSDHIIGDKYVEMNYVAEKNAFEVIAHILDFMIDSINEQMNKSDGSDKPIRSFIRKYCDLYHLCFGYYEVLDNVFYSL